METTALVANQQDGGISKVKLALGAASLFLFIVGIKRLGRVRTARGANQLAAFAMFLAVLGTLLELGFIDYRWILGGVLAGGLLGAIAAVRVPMTQMPEMVALFNGSGGASSTLVALSVYWLSVVEPGTDGTAASVLGAAESVTVVLSVIVGGITLTGSLVAYGKLNGSLKKGEPILLPGRHVLNAMMLVGAMALGGMYCFGIDTAEAGTTAVLAVTALSLVLGVTLTIPIGGADMPVVVSLLNSYSGVAASMTGFVIGNNLLIISGAMVGAAGIILTQIMCVAMNRSLLNVLVGGFGVEAAGGASGGSTEYENVRSAGAEEAALTLEGAESVVFVPGYGLAVAQAQHATRELADLLEQRGCKVSYAIHPVAGRMPGHMNVLLAEADVPYEQLLEMDIINPELKNTDVVIVLGANDVVNPAAVNTKSSPIYGMPILNVHEAKTVFVVKRSLGAGYAGVKNELFEYPNTMMIFGDAKKVLQQLLQELKGLA
jgi:H+-translocating NAD(P) transhydrogenase subunit beta